VKSRSSNNSHRKIMAMTGLELTPKKTSNHCNTSEGPKKKVMVRVGVEPTRRTTKNSKRTTRPARKNWGTVVTVQLARETHRTSRGTKEKTLVQEVLELAKEMIDGTHSPTKTDLE
jgi:hypothetical protein